MSNIPDRPRRGSVAFIVPKPAIPEVVEPKQERRKSISLFSPPVQNIERPKTPQPIKVEAAKVEAVKVEPVKEHKKGFKTLTSKIEHLENRKECTCDKTKSDLSKEINELKAQLERLTNTVTDLIEN